MADLKPTIPSPEDIFGGAQPDGGVPSPEDIFGGGWADMLKDQAAKALANTIAPGSGELLGPALREGTKQIQESPMGEFLPGYGDTGAAIGTDLAMSAVPVLGQAARGYKIISKLPRGLKALSKVAGVVGGGAAGQKLAEVVGGVPGEQRAGAFESTLNPMLALASTRLLSKAGAVSEEMADQAAVLYRKILTPTQQALKKGGKVVEEVTEGPFGEVAQQKILQGLDKSGRVLMDAGAFDDGARSIDDILLGADRAKRSAGNTIGQLTRNKPIPKSLYWEKAKGLIEEMSNIPASKEGMDELSGALDMTNTLNKELWRLFKSTRGEGVPVHRIINLRRDWADRAVWDPTLKSAEKQAASFWHDAAGKLSAMTDELFASAFPDDAAKLKKANAVWGAASDWLAPAWNTMAKSMKGGSAEMTRLMAQGATLSGAGYLAASAIPGPQQVAPMTAAMIGLPSLAAATIAGVRSPMARGMRAGMLTTGSRVMGLLPRSAEQVLEDGGAEFIGKLTQLGVDAKIIQTVNNLIGEDNIDGLDALMSNLYATQPALAEEAEPSPISGYNVVGGKIRDPIERFAYGEQRKRELSGRESANQLTKELQALNEDGTILQITIEPESPMITVPQPVQMNTVPIAEPTSSFADGIRRVDKDY